MFAATVAVRRFISRFEVAGTSMAPSLSPGDWLLCEAASLGVRGPRRGQVVVLESPLAPGLRTVKRVAAVEGDVVNVGSGVLAVQPGRVGGRDGGNGSSVRSPERYEIRPGEIFVTGDNSSASTDSREFGPVPIDSVIAIARYRYRAAGNGSRGFLGAGPTGTG